MLITLKQHEIVAALRLYVATNGINLSGKTLDVAFTAGRKESGLSAEVSIEDDGSKALDPVQAGVTLAVAAAADPAPVAVPAADTQAEIPVAAPGGSLFGG